jgi:hypothetical protein
MLFTLYISGDSIVGFGGRKVLNKIVSPLHPAQGHSSRKYFSENTVEVSSFQVKDSLSLSIIFICFGLISKKSY